MTNFSPTQLLALDATKYLYIRAGVEHRFTFIWVTAVGGRVLVRSWNDKAKGWYRAFLKEKKGAIQLEGREIAVRARRVRGTKLLDAMDVAYGEKYTSKANLKYVKGFATAKRRAATLELLPA
jgi:hypothetical protein